jgi:hypothetical protein
MVNHDIMEGHEYEIQDLLEDPDVRVGDTITLQTNNQMGYKKWEVVEKSVKDIKLIDSYDHQMGEYGGKRRRKSHKRRAHRKRRTRRRSRK